LAGDEIQHKDRLWEEYKAVTEGHETREAFETETVTKTLEDGRTADQVLAQYPDWIERPQEALELAMSLETDSLDLYLRMAQKSRNNETSAVFYALANEEKTHLKSLGEVFRRKVASE